MVSNTILLWGAVIGLVFGLALVMVYKVRKPTVWYWLGMWFVMGISIIGVVLTRR